MQLAVACSGFLRMEDMSAGNKGTRPVFDISAQTGRGGRFALTCYDVTALVLRWFCTRHRQDDLCLEFGVTRSTIEDALAKGSRAMLRALRVLLFSRFDSKVHDSKPCFLTLLGVPIDKNGQKMSKFTFSGGGALVEVCGAGVDPSADAAACYVAQRTKTKLAVRCANLKSK